jgi:hypothetical protein
MKRCQREQLLGAAVGRKKRNGQRRRWLEVRSVCYLVCPDEDEGRRRIGDSFS